MRRTCAPPFASSAAIEAATLDLPSLGAHDVRPTVRPEPVASLLKSRPSLSDRMDSLYSEPGTSMIDCNSCGTVEMLRGPARRRVVGSSCACQLLSAILG